jgi:hypothetical protein
MTEPSLVLSEINSKLVWLQAKREHLTQKIIFFKRATKLKRLDEEIKSLQKVQDCLVDLLDVVRFGEISFKTKDIRFPFENKIKSMGFYLVKRNFIKDVWIWTYRMGK